MVKTTDVDEHDGDGGTMAGSREEDRNVTAPGDAATAAIEALATLARRLDEVETQLAFQDDLHRRLDETVARQDREIMELKRQLRALAERMAEMRDAGVTATGSPADEVPPHY